VTQPSSTDIETDISSCAAFAQDIWQDEFAKDPYNRTTRDRYRRTILRYGGAHPDKMQMLRDFLGRDPNADALVESLEQGTR
jgi:Zn-dependent oligopeptidase